MKGGGGSAYLAGPRCAVTAAHCVFDDKNNNVIFSNWVCFAGYRNGFYLGQPSGWSQVYYSDNWMNTHDSNYDWAICVLQEDFSEAVGWFGTSSASSNDLLNLNVTTYGYPANDKYGYNGLYQYVTGYKIKSVSDKKFTYGGNTTGGFSGGPIARDSDNYVVGVHRAGNSKFVGEGVRISQDMINIIKDINSR